MVYADYDFYVSTFFGNAIAEEDFPRLVKRASERVDSITRYQAEKHYAEPFVQSYISNATCAIAEVLQQAERGNLLLRNVADGLPVKTEIVGKHHITYMDAPNTASQEGQRAMDRAVMTAACTHLLPTGLLYRGVT